MLPSEWWFVMSALTMMSSSQCLRPTYECWGEEAYYGALSYMCLLSTSLLTATLLPPSSLPPSSLPPFSIPPHCHHLPSLLTATLLTATIFPPSPLPPSLPSSLPPSSLLHSSRFQPWKFPMAIIAKTNRLLTQYYCCIGTCACISQ